MTPEQELDERWRLFRDEAARHADDPARIATVFDDHRALIEAAVHAAAPAPSTEETP